MKRLTPLLLLVLLAPSAARGDGCAPSVCGMLSETPPGSPLLLLRPNGTFGPARAYDLATGRARFSLPFGVASADGRVFLSAKYARARTTVARYDARTGRRLGGWTAARGWWLGGLSANGRYAAAVDARSNGVRTRLAVVLSDNGTVVDRLTLAGPWEVETVSNDGRRLFLIEHTRNSPDYRVRLYDLAHDRLVPGGIRVENEDEPMRGWGVRAVASADGRWLLTLYVNGRKSFVHALDLRRGVAQCLDLPGRAGPAKLVQWALTLTPDGGRLVAANPTLGRAVSLDLTTLRIRTLASFKPASSAAAAFTNAAAAPDGRVAFGSVHALWVLERGRVRALPALGKVGGFGWGPDGRLTVVLTTGKALRIAA